MLTSQTSFSESANQQVIEQQIVAGAAAQANVNNATGTNFTNVGAHIEANADLAAQAADLQNIADDLTDNNQYGMVDIASAVIMGMDVAMGGQITAVKLATGIAGTELVKSSINNFQNSKTEGTFNDVDENDMFAATVDSPPKPELKAPTAPAQGPTLDEQMSFAAEQEYDKTAALDNVRKQQKLVAGGQAHQQEHIANVTHVSEEQSAKMDKNLSYEQNIALNPDLQKESMIGGPSGPMPA